MTKRTRIRIFADSNGKHAVAMTLAIVLALAACGPPTATPLPSESASARPTRSPIPTLAEGMTRFKGTITDAATGYPVENVCVIIGQTSDCLENMPHSDENGVWFADLPVAGGSLSWTFKFVKDGYALATAPGVSDAPGEKKLDISLQPK